MSSPARAANGAAQVLTWWQSVQMVTVPISSTEWWLTQRPSQPTGALCLPQLVPLSEFGGDATFAQSNAHLNAAQFWNGTGWQNWVKCKHG